MDKIMLSIKGNLLFHFFYIVILCVFILFDNEFSFAERVYMILVVPPCFMIGIPAYYFLGRLSSFFTKTPKYKVILLVAFYTLYYLILLSLFVHEPIHKVVLFFFSGPIDMIFKYIMSYILSWFLVITQLKHQDKTLNRENNITNISI